MTPGILAAPPTQADIIARWHPERGQQVSVCMLAYNHAPYIRDALNSILNQKTDFGFEILVHDDASQDATPAILREYAERYPAIVKPILQSVNQHSQGIYPSVHFNYPRAKLPFVAMCEGDDHWSDENKLQLQVDGLLAHPEINLSFHSAVRVNCEDPDDEDKVYGDYATSDAVLPFTDILYRVRGWIPFASCMIRQSAKVRFLDFLKTKPYLTVGEIYFQLFGSLPGGALFFARPMSVYRFRTEQSWTRKAGLDASFKARHEMAMIRSYVDLDQLTENAYHDEFMALIVQRLLWLFNPDAPPRTLPGIAQLDSIHTACQVKIARTLNRLQQTPARYVVFGCASGCKRVLQSLSPDKVVAIVDRDNRRNGETLEGKPIIGTDALADYPDCELLVSTITANRRDVSRLAGTAGISAERIHYLFDGALDFLNSHPVPPDVFSP